MAKGKDTLRHLNEFLSNRGEGNIGEQKEGDFYKQEPKTLVNVKSTSELMNMNQEEVTEENLVTFIKSMAESQGISIGLFLSRLNIKSLEAVEKLDPSSLMLLNTSLYINHSEQIQQKVKNLEGENG